MRAEVIKEFKVRGKEFEIGDIFNVKGDALIIEDGWLCDLGSVYFNLYFKLVGNKS